MGPPADSASSASKYAATILDTEVSRAAAWRFAASIRRLSMRSVSFVATSTFWRTDHDST